MVLFKQNLADRLHKLEDEFKTKNPRGYVERQSLIRDIDIGTVKHVSNNKEIKFEIHFTKDTWGLLSAFKPKNCSFYANDVTRLQYLEYSKVNTGFMGSLPSMVILDKIVNFDTMDVLNKVEPHNLLEKFNTTIHGKRIKYLFNDFGLEIANIEMDKSQRQANDCDIFITTKLADI
ncbi:hypothetical protein ACFX5K_00595 [Rickettsiales bacterium LUAb2]